MREGFEAWGLRRGVLHRSMGKRYRDRWHARAGRGGGLARLKNKASMVVEPVLARERDGCSTVRHVQLCGRRCCRSSDLLEDALDAVQRAAAQRAEAAAALVEAAGARCAEAFVAAWQHDVGLRRVEAEAACVVGVVR